MLGYAARNELVPTTTSNCSCPGEIITYECTIVSGSFTLWSVGAGCQILLRHSQPFTDSLGTCNNGEVVAQGVEVNNNCFTSQLNILLTLDLDQRTVECSSLRGDFTGADELSLTTGK